MKKKKDNTILQDNYMMIDNKILSINANYKFSSEVKYISFLGDAEDNKMNILTSSQNGFAVINKNGIQDINDLFIGYLKVAIPASATPNSTYNIGLTNIEYSTDEYKMLELGDTKTNVRIKNNDATLSNIVVNGYELDKEFNKLSIFILKKYLFFYINKTNVRITKVCG